MPFSMKRKYDLSSSASWTSDRISRLRFDGNRIGNIGLVNELRFFKKYFSFDEPIITQKPLIVNTFLKKFQKISVIFVVNILIVLTIINIHDNSPNSPPSEGRPRDLNESRRTTCQFPSFGGAPLKGAGWSSTGNLQHPPAHPAYKTGRGFLRVPCFTSYILV